MKTKRLDIMTLKKMGLYGMPNTENFYAFQDPIEYVEIERMSRGYGGVPFSVNFSNDNELLFSLVIKGNVVSSSLTTHYKDSKGHICADPRIIATFIMASWMDFLFQELPNYDESDLETALNPIFSIDGALEWLEKNYFIGAHSLWNRARDCGDFDSPYNMKEYPEVEERLPGWNIFEKQREFFFVPPQAQEFYNTHIGTWRKLQSLRSKWTGKPKDILQAELDRLYEKGDDETIELFEQEFGYLLEDDDFNGKVGDILVKE